MVVKMKALVVYFSRTGTTRQLASVIAASLGAEVEEIKDNVDRAGIWGYLRSASEGWLARPAAIDKPRFDPAQFDLVVIGTPVWRMSVSTPVRRYITDHAPKLGRVAFFCTMGGTGDRRTFKQLEVLCGKPPVARLALRQADVMKDGGAQATAAFVQQIKAGAPV